MKKTLIVSAVFCTFISSSAFARTQGNYLGIDLINTNFESQDFYGKKHNDDNISFGLNYKYAFNFNGIFIAPGAFYNYNNSQVEFHDQSNIGCNSNFCFNNNYKSKLKYSYGLKLDLGYDITDKLALYGFGGYSENRLSLKYNANIEIPNINFSDSYSIGKNFTEETLLFGFGAKYSVSDKVDLNLAYERSKYDVTFRELTQNGDDRMRNMDIQLFKIGFSYNF